MLLDEHENGQLRLGVAGEQVSLLPLPVSGIPAGDGPALASPALDELAGRYAVLCDECKAVLRRTDSVGESAAGGLCSECRTDPRVVGPTRARLERKAERRREWAGSRAVKSDRAHEAARTIADGIPFGQPILVGHHSEGRHRRDVARLEQNMRAAVDHDRMAKEHDRKADGIERQLAGAIYSDDLDAVERLEERIAALEEERERVKRYNALRRRRKLEAPEGLEQDACAAGLTAGETRNLIDTIRVQSCACPFGQFPAYHLQNLGGNIARNRKRLEQLKRNAATVEAGGRGRGRMMLARFGSDCAGCGGRIEKGSPIVYYKLVREAVHAACDADVGYDGARHMVRSAGLE